MASTNKIGILHTLKTSGAMPIKQAKQLRKIGSILLYAVYAALVIYFIFYVLT